MRHVYMGGGVGKCMKVWRDTIRTGVWYLYTYPPVADFKMYMYF